MGRGRPKGSKNKPKTETPPVEAVVKKKPGRKPIPKTLTPERSERPTESFESAYVVFHMKGGAIHRFLTLKAVGDRIANEWISLGNLKEVIGGQGWAIRLSEVVAVLTEPVATEPPKKKRGRPAGKK